MNVLISLIYVFISSILFLICAVGVIYINWRFNIVPNQLWWLLPYIVVFYYMNRRILININSIEKIQRHRDVWVVGVIYVFVYIFLFFHVLFMIFPINFRHFGTPKMYEDLARYFFLNGEDSYMGSYLGEVGVVFFVLFLYGVLIYGKVFLSSRKKIINKYLLISSSIFFYTLLIPSIYACLSILVYFSGIGFMYE